MTDITTNKKTRHCVICDKKILTKNFARHLRQVHGGSHETPELVTPSGVLPKVSTPHGLSTKLSTPL